ncbi:hemagglutinin repeat-containing protein [Proteus sp. G2673]|uniref:hemagglutinin repeat-containing protein n=1 Tax=Proteus sp. G2673 TaxID=2698885 RepID=UPI0013768387|nr:hemagglutinin repeat-containing protein [Proteus sp. G2673]NBL89375.1 filamentous hemagglutinin N-terminal domain-containing protein [Proteus sp. G2673]
MNKHCYRLIFSRTHGELRVVSELTKSCSTEAGQTRGSQGTRIWVTLRRSAFLLWLALGSPYVLANGIVADNNAPQNQRPEVINTQNGLPQVNISAPNEAGISHNQYKQFDVDQRGAILNNSAVMTSTQTAGMIQGNANLDPNKAPARVILNEVNSNNPSQLKGFIEVAGGKAQVIIANPSGIICNGCGTINAGRMTLTTGKPQLNPDGSLAGYRVENGVIHVEGGGLNGDSRHDTQYVDLLAQAVKINAGVWAKEKIEVVAGRNQVDTQNNATALEQKEKTAKPEFAIDMGQMGGMYSGQIKMVGTEQGVGVRNQGGHLQANKTLTVTSQGQLVWQSTKTQEAVTQAGGDINLIAKEDLIHQGKLHSGGQLRVESQDGALKQSGTLAATKDVTLIAQKEIQTQGNLLAGSDLNSQIIQDANLTLNSQNNIRAQGNLLNKKAINITAKQVDLSQSQIATSTLAIKATQGDARLDNARVDTHKVDVIATGNISSQQAKIKAQSWDIDGNHLFNQKGIWTQTGKSESRFALKGLFNNTKGSVEAYQLSLNGQDLNNTDGRLVMLNNSQQHWQFNQSINNQRGELGNNGNLQLDTQHLNSESGSIKSPTQLIITAKSGINNQKGQLLSGEQLILNTDNSLNNQSGKINSNQIDIKTSLFNNTQGQLVGQDTLTLSTQKTLTNTQGFIGAGKALTLSAQSDLNNQAGIVQSESLFNLVANHIDNQEGQLLSGHQMKVKAASLSSSKGNISAKEIDLNANTVSNVAGKIIGQDRLTLTTHQLLDNTQGTLLTNKALVLLNENNLINDNGLIQSGEITKIDAQNISNNQGKLLAGQQITLTTPKNLDNQKGEISAKSLAVTTDQLTNQQGKLVATDNLDLIAHQSLNNTHGLLEAGKTLKITTAGRWNNQEGITQAGHQIIASADTIDNTQGQLQSGDKLTFKTTHDVINTLGKITAQHLLQWQGHDNSQFNNNNGLLQSNGTLTLEGGALSNQQQGNIFSQKALQLVLKGDLLNQHGKITSNENSVIKANNLINTQGEINSLNTLNIDLLEQLDNRQGRLFSQSSQHLQATDILNTKGWMGSLDTWFAKASAFNNQTGQIQSQKEASLVANTFDNTNGLLQSSDSAQLRIAKSINNTQGKISAQNTVDAQGTQPNGAIETVNNIAGQWLAGNRLNLHVLNLDNSQHGLLYSQQHTQLAVDNALNNRQGKIQSEDNLALTAKTLYNQSGSIDGQQGVTLTLADLLDNSQGKIRSNQHQSIYGSRIQNHQGHISSQGELTVNGAQLDNTQGMLISQKNSHYDIEHINNNAGKIHSGQSLTLTATDLQNQQGQLVSTQALKVNTAQLDNHNNGILSSQDALNITTNTLNNRDNGLIWGTTQNVISAKNIDNTQGRLQSNGLLSLNSLSLLNNQKGHILANGAIAINAKDAPIASTLMLLNQRGVIQSGDKLTLNTQTFNNQGGTLQSEKALTLTAKQDYTRRDGDILKSNQSVSLSISGVFTNLADWLLPASLTIKSQDMINSGTLVSRALNFNTGLLKNRGRLEADDFTFNLTSLDNSATIMGDNGVIHTQLLENKSKNAVIATTQSLDLAARDKLINHDGALIYSGDKLSLSGSFIENKASFIEAEGDVSITADQLHNLREGLEIEREAEKSDYRWHRYHYFWRSYNSKVITDPTPFAPTTQKLTFNDDNAVLNNKYGTLTAIDASGKRAQVLVNNVNDNTPISLWVHYESLIPNSDGTYNMTFYQTTGFEQINGVPTPYHNTVWREFSGEPRIEQWDPNIHVSSYDLKLISDYSNFRERTVSGTATRDKLISEGIGARILSGGNMKVNISERLFNDASMITSMGDQHIEGNGKIDNKAYSVNERRQEYIVDHYDKDTKHWYPSFNNDETTALATIDSIISGNGNVTIKGASITNTTVNAAQINTLEAALKAVEAERAEFARNPLAFNIKGVDKQTANTEVTTGSKSEITHSDATSPLARPLLPSEIALTEKQHLGNVITDLPDNGLFRQNIAPDNPFLIVTDERFTSRTKFISSDYLLDRVGYDPAQVPKRLGDGFYEQRLVREQVLKLTGRPSLYESDAMAQYQYLMNNGVKVASDFHLRPGVALTPEQITSLEQDIVWLVSETVDTAQGPQTVLVPKVYLANKTLNLLNSGAIVSGDHLHLSADSINNAGQLLANKGLEIDANQFEHQGGDIRGENVNIQADSINLSTNLQDALRQARINGTDITLKGHDIQLQGAKLDALNDINLNARDNLTITTAKSTHSSEFDVISGSMGSRTENFIEEPGEHRLAHLSGEWQRAQGSELNAGGNLNLTAVKDVTLQGSQVKADEHLTVNAGENLNILADSTTTKSHLDANSKSTSVSNTREEERLQLSTLSGDKGVSLNVGHTLTAQGAQVDSTEGKTTVRAQDVDIQSVTKQIEDSDYQHSGGGRKSYSRLVDTAQENVVGSTFSGQQGVEITAREGDINLTGSTLHSEKGAVDLSATQNINLNTATETHTEFLEEHSKSKGFLSSSQTHTLQNDHVTREQGSVVSGEQVNIQAGKDIQVTGSSVVAENDVSLTAGNNVDITAATETDSHYLLEEKKKSGLMSSGGIGFSVGKQSSRHEVDEKGTTQSQSVSTIGSTQGNVNITAGNKLHVGGADLIAQKDLNLTGDSVQIDPGYDERTRTETFETKQSGFSVALSGSAGSALNTAVSTAQQARKESDGRLSALQNTKAVLSGVQAQQAVELDGLKTDAANAHNLANNLKPGDEDYQKGATNTVGVSVSYGSQSSKSETHTDSRQSQGSTLNAGQNLSITATGKNKDTNPDSGNITVVGSELKAGKDLSLSATQDINLVSAQNTEQTTSQNRSKGGSIGVGVGVGEGGYGVNVSASVNQGKGHEKGNALTHTETTLDAGNKLTLNSGQDTTLKGAQVSGEQVTINVGRDLTLQSEQDSDRYDAKQQEVSVGGGYTLGGTPNINISASKDKIHSNYDSVKEQTGIFAGKGGFDVNVKDHTQLDGAVIASTADKGNNHLETGTLGWKDIDNKADFTAEHTGGSIGTGGPIGSQLVTNAAGGLLSNANNSGHAEGTTQSAVSDGSVIVRNEDKQKQDINKLNRDTDHANDGSINPIFDKEKEQNRLKQAQLIGEIGNQAMDIIRTEGNIAGLKAQKDPDALAIAKKQLEAAGKTPTEQTIKDQAYNNAMAQYGTGSDFQKAAQAVTGLLQGLAGDNLAGALANASSPYLATLIKQQVGEENKAANAMAHAVLGAVVAELNNQSAAAGGLGAGSGELAARYIAKELFPNKDVSELTESEKQQVSALSQLASGLAGGLTTGDIAGAITGSQAGKNAVENNFLHSEQIMSFVDAQAKTKTPEERKQLQKDIDTLDKQLQSQAERWGISTNDMKSALDSLKTLEGLPDCNAQCQDMVKDSISKLEPALENRIAKHSSQTENLKELTGILATVIVLNESGLIDGNSKGNNTSSVVTKPNVTTTKPNEQVPPKTVPNQTGGDKLGNYQVHDLKQVTDPALNLDSIRNATQQYLKKPLQQDGAAVSYATASVTVNGKTEYYLSVSGKSWSGKSPDTVNIDGVTYKVIRDDKNSFTSVGNIESKRTNFNHAEQKLFNHIQDAYKGQKADVNMAIQNTSNRDPGMCVSCGYTSKNFAENNKDLNVKIYQGSTGENK